MSKTITRREHSTLKHSLTAEQCIERIHSLMDTMPKMCVKYANKDISFNQVASVSWEAGWATEAGLTVVCDIKRVKTEENEELAVATFTCEIGWSSTGRSLAGATAAVAMYQRAIEFAALVENITAGQHIHRSKTERMQNKD